MEELTDQTIINYLKRKADRLSEELNATQVMINYMQPKVAPESTIGAYNPRSTYAEKILYILKLKGDVFTKDLVAFIAEHEPKLNNKALPPTIGKIAKRLVDTHKIKVEKIGSANRYSLV